MVGIEKVQHMQDDFVRFIDNLQTRQVLKKQEQSQQSTASIDKAKIPVISPAFRWAQSLHFVFLEVKFSTRFDSPACIDLIDKQVRLTNQQLTVEAICRLSDKTLLKYFLDINLTEKVALLDEDVTPAVQKEYDQMEASYQEEHKAHAARIETFNYQMSILREAAQNQANKTIQEEEDFDDDQNQSEQQPPQENATRAAGIPKFDKRYFYMPTKE